MQTPPINLLKQHGSRLTKARKQLLNILEDSKLPLTQAEIGKQLAKRRTAVNKTTIYRELDYFKSQNLVREVDFGDGKKRYEINSGGHHHHLVCTNCKQIDDIAMENDLTEMEKKIKKLKAFKITNHSLEFFGVCANCLNK